MAADVKAGEVATVNGAKITITTEGGVKVDNAKVVAATTLAFSTLVAAVTAAGLVEALSGDGPFTVFASTNEAFAKLPEGTVETLLKPENKNSSSQSSPTT